MSLVQEKLQVSSTPNRNEDGTSGAWVSTRSARVTKGISRDHATMYNALPPGMDIHDQAVSDQRRMPHVLAGTTDRTVTVNAKSLQQGFYRHPCCPTDDEYTNAHTDAFYDEVTVDGVTGFVERNNNLDRL